MQAKNPQNCILGKIQLEALPTIALDEQTPEAAPNHSAASEAAQMLAGDAITAKANGPVATGTAYAIVVSSNEVRAIATHYTATRLSDISGQ